MNSVDSIEVFKLIFNDDFSSCEVIGTRTGDSVELMQHEGVVYQFTKPGWPSACKYAEKKPN